jgi:hypothetical protein
MMLELAIAWDRRLRRERLQMVTELTFPALDTIVSQCGDSYETEIDRG